MKKFTFFTVLCLIMAAFFANDTRAQEPDGPAMVLLMEEFVAPSDMAQFWKVQSEALELFDELNFDMTFYAYQTDQNSFYWAMPIKSFADIDEVYSTMMNSHKLLKENGYDPDAKFRNLSNISQSVVMWNKELSYHPEEREEGAEPDKFYEWSFIYLKSGHEKEVAEATKKYMDFYKSVGVNYAWDIYEVVFGDHTPCWILEVSAESELALRQQESDLQAKYHDDFMKLWQNLVPHVRTIETKKGWYLPAWSKHESE